MQSDQEVVHRPDSSSRLVSPPPPRRLLSDLRAFLKAQLRKFSVLLGPAAFSLRTGHFLSAATGRSMDRHGNPLPWYCYPAIRFLSQKDFSDADVLEFGGGQSTRWWASRAKSVLCFDPYEQWVSWLRQHVPANVTVHHLEHSSDVGPIVGDRRFDVIVVDAGTAALPYEGRTENARTAFGLLRPGGIIIVDNSTPKWGHPISELAASLGWARIDFIGFAPGGVSEYGTSIFFQTIPKVAHSGLPPRVII